MAIFNVEENSDHIVVRASGDFVGGEETDKLRDTLRGLAVKDINKIIFDLSNVNFLASIALGVLLSANAFIQKNKGKFVLFNPNDYLKSIFEITKLPLILTICDTEEEAREDVLS